MRLEESIALQVKLTSEQGARLQDDALQVAWRFFHLGGKIAARGGHKEGLGFTVGVS